MTDDNDVEDEPDPPLSDYFLGQVSHSFSEQEAHAAQEVLRRSSATYPVRKVNEVIRHRV